MQAVKIILSSAERKRCVCGATLQMSCDPDDSRRTQLWRCNHHCGARGRSYEGALRRKVRLDPQLGRFTAQSSTVNRRGHRRLNKSSSQAYHFAAPRNCLSEYFP